MAFLGVAPRGKKKDATSRTAVYKGLGGVAGVARGKCHVKPKNPRRAAFLLGVARGIFSPLRGAVAFATPRPRDGWG